VQEFKETNGRKRTMGRSKPDMIKGTLDMLILKMVSLEPMHGWGISERIQHVSRDALQVNQGSLYSSLHKLTREGWIKSYWEVTENNRRAKYYTLTRAGRKHLGEEAKHWDRLATGVTRIMALS
jgi:transcriptional regulator